MKGCYPWRIGATSFVVPADIRSNVEVLAGMVDDVQLLFFESEARAGLPHDLDVAALRQLAEEHVLSYTVHLPADIFLGHVSCDVREQGIDEILRVVERLAPLEPGCFDLHLALDRTQPLDAWLDRLEGSLEKLAIKLGEGKRNLAVENTDYPFAVVAPLVERLGLGTCLDLGHVLFYRHDWDEALGRLHTARHIHYHGVHSGRDHQALAVEDRRRHESLGRALRQGGYHGVMTVEVYDLQKLENSLATLRDAWAAVKE